MPTDVSQPKSPLHRNIFHGDVSIWVIFFLLCAISIVEVYSAASTLTYKSGVYWRPILEHSIFLFVGFLIVLGVHNIPCRWFKLYPIFMLPFSVILLIIVMAVGAVTNGAARWTTFFGIPLQPSEIAKGAVVILVAFILSALQTEKGADRHAFRYIISITVVVCGFILPENFSTAIILFCVVLAMMIIGRVPVLQIGKLLGILAILAAIIFGGMMMMPNKVNDSIPGMHRMSTWKARIERFSDNKDSKQQSPKDYDMDKNAQVAHAHIAIATSNVIGKLPGNSVERDFLSQAFSDFIFAIIIEELGLLGGGFVVLLYIILLFRAARIANRCERNFPAFLVLGLSLLLVVQAIVNMAVAVGLFPVTGQPLPLISKGGTSTLINCMYIGMILSVSRFAKKRDNMKPTSTSVNEQEFTRTEGMT